MPRKRSTRRRKLGDGFWPPLPLGSDEIGLPPHDTHRLQAISYNKPARTLVAVVQPLTFVADVDQRIFVREIGEARYRELPLPDALASITHVLVCSEHPFAIANIMKWLTAERQGANDLGLYRVNLPSGLLQKLPEPINPITAPETVSVTSLLAVSADAHELHLVVSVPIFVRLPPQHGYAMGFFLASYDTRTGYIELIDEAPAVLA